MDIVEQYGRALDQTGRIVAGVQPDQLEAPTPCTEWNVRMLLNHLIGWVWRTARLAGGENAPLTRGISEEDFVGEDPAASYKQAAEAAKQAWSDPSALARAYAMPFGTLPGQALMALRITEVITHGWDLARATGQDPKFDDNLVATAMSFSEANLAGARAAGSPFAPSVEVSGDLPAIDRLAAFMGRQP